MAAFASIQGVVGLFGLINGCICLTKCKRKVCPAKKPKEKIRLAGGNNKSELEMSEVEPGKRKGPKYNEFI